MGTKLRFVMFAFSFVMPLVYSAVGVAAIATLRWSMAGVGVWMFGRAHLSLRMKQVWLGSPETENESADDVALDIMRRTGAFYAVVSLLLVVGAIVGEGWGWAVFAGFLLWMAVLYSFGDVSDLATCRRAGFPDRATATL